MNHTLLCNICEESEVDQEMHPQWCMSCFQRCFRCGDVACTCNNTYNPNPAKSAQLSVDRLVCRLAQDQWLLWYIPQLPILARYEFSWQQAARLRVIDHWLQKWYNRTALYSKREAEQYLMRVILNFTSRLRLNQKFRNKIFKIFCLIMHFRKPSPIIPYLCDPLTDCIYAYL